MPIHSYQFFTLLFHPPVHFRALAEQKAEKFIAEMPLNELRAARKMTQRSCRGTQRQAGGSLKAGEARRHVREPASRYIEAMGGELEITARFPEGSVRINQFEEDESGAALEAKK